MVPSIALTSRLHPFTGFHLGFLSRGGKRDNSRVKGAGVTKTIVYFSTREE